MSGQIRNIANTKLFLTKEELSYSESLKTLFGADVFMSLFQSNDAGYITSITPNLEKTTPMPVLFFLLNISFNQRMRRLDSFISRIEGMEKKIKAVQEKINILEKNDGV